MDGCGGSNYNTPYPLISKWFLEEGKAAGRPVLYHPSCIALLSHKPQYKLFGKVANMWRHSADMQPSWHEVNKIIDFWAADSNDSHLQTYPNETQNWYRMHRLKILDKFLKDLILKVHFASVVNSSTLCKKFVKMQ